MTTTIQHTPIPQVSRREFLTYAWLGSMGLLAAQGVGIVLWANLRHEKDYTVILKEGIPDLEYSPADFLEGNFWLSHSESGLVALQKTCTHPMCEIMSWKVKWVDANFRFECPYHGSKFEIDGTYIEGPAGRHLDRYAITILTTGGKFESNATGDPIKVDIEAIKEIRVHTKWLIQGKPRF